MPFLALPSKVAFGGDKHVIRTFTVEKLNDFGRRLTLIISLV